MTNSKGSIMKLKTCLAILTVAFSMLTVTGCSLLNQQQTASPADDHQAAGQALSKYYDFDDVQVPAKMKLDKDRSNVMRVGDFKAGVIVLNANLDAESLANFFMEAMAKDNWKLKGADKYPGMYLFFAKPGKAAVVRITEGTMDTEVVIWVLPAN